VDSNRTSEGTYPADSTGACSSSTSPTTINHSYDQADRISNTGYSYDNLGRTLTLPGSDTGAAASGSLTATYFANDMVQSQTQDGHSKTWALDPAGRLLDETDSVTSKTSTSIYASASDSPAWIAVSDGTWTRNAEDLAGGLAAVQGSAGSVTLQIENLHGDVVATVDDSAAAAGLASYFESTEFGAPRTTNTVAPTRYGWLGGMQRSADTLGGLVLMGARQYNPVIGRFLSRDAFAQGSANDYDYVFQDPVNAMDLNGRTDWRRTDHWAELTIGMSLDSFGVYNGAMRYRFAWAATITPQLQDIGYEGGTGVAFWRFSANVTIPGSGVNYWHVGGGGWQPLGYAFHSYVYRQKVLGTSNTYYYLHHYDYIYISGSAKFTTYYAVFTISFTIRCRITTAGTCTA
jgi:RHS repeat-associated protein